MKDYLKYYWLETEYLEGVHSSFHKKRYLTPEEFFAIIIWKRNAAKTKIKDALIEKCIDIEKLTGDISKESNLRKKLELLTSIDQIGISFASAILTICYPDDFTIVDYRTCTTLKKLGEKIKGDPMTNVSTYFEYLKKCKELTSKYNCSLRDFDRILWAMDFYDGKNGLKELVEKYNKKEYEKNKS